MAKPATKAAAAPEVKTRKGSSRSAKKPRNPERAKRDLDKAAKAKLSGERKRAFAASASPSALPSSGADSYSNRKARRAAWRKANPDLAASREAARTAKATRSALTPPEKEVMRAVYDRADGIPVGSMMTVAALSPSGKSALPA
jgi:hypothetical protein